MTLIWIRCFGTQKCSQMYQIDYIFKGFFSCIQPSEIPIEIPHNFAAEILIKPSAEIPFEIALEMLVEIAVSKSATKLPC